MVLMRSCTPSSPSASIFLGVSATLNRRARRLVDAGVGRLRRQHHGHQQREGIDVFQLALGLGVGGGKAPEDLRDALRRDLGRLAAARALGRRRGVVPVGRLWASGLRARPIALVGLQS